MNRVNPKKLLNTKWTAVMPINKEKHFIITKVEFDEEGEVLGCVIEAIMSKREQAIQWQNLQDSNVWLQGWK
ncbi:MAG: TIGR02450 family Trp-rich protein [Paraglaciecola sp.]|uniref:TIGR02450 family Trp-rich protein n=1 Tax=Paraglaciecola sp. TaxID=1920173 RepID=UPI00273DE301|nr:TIGR02450 family Trp-rich protein [Paraglaciecola sp.]MDP5030042.1 TIGR02450 family Trp-rich protein [Paraglaciecola sp.]MDP5132840.1 TIGR02450 family Trp-rich protein [Paraglaciecola sp.]